MSGLRSSRNLSAPPTVIMAGNLENFPCYGTCRAQIGPRSGHFGNAFCKQSATSFIVIVYLDTPVSPFSSLLLSTPCYTDLLNLLESHHLIYLKKSPLSAYWYLLVTMDKYKDTEAL